MFRYLHWRSDVSAPIHHSTQDLVAVSKHAAWALLLGIFDEGAHRLLVDRLDRRPVAYSPALVECVVRCLVEDATVTRIDVPVAVEYWMDVTEVARLRRCWRLVLHERHLRPDRVVDEGRHL